MIRCRGTRTWCRRCSCTCPRRTSTGSTPTIAGAVRSGGTLLVAGHHPAERDTDLRNPRLSHLLFAPERVTSLLDDGWRVDVADARTRDVVGHDGEPRVATDTVVVARRA